MFPRSVYARTKYGELPLIPGGTVFYIGAPSFLTNPSPEPEQRDSPIANHAVSHRMNERQMALPFTGTARAGTRLHPSPWRPRPSASNVKVVERTIITDPAYRAERLRLLMRQAAQGRQISNG